MFKKNWFQIAVALIVLITFGVPVANAIDVWGNKKKRVVTQVATSNQPLSTTWTPSSGFKVLWASIHLNAANTTADVLALTIDSGNGAAYDTIIASKAMNGVQDYVLDLSAVDAYYEKGDGIKMTFANSDSRTYGLVLKYEIR